MVPSGRSCKVDSFVSASHGVSYYYSIQENGAGSLSGIFVEIQGIIVSF
jgi:hypothetical protein